MGKNPNVQDACQITPWVSGYSVYSESDYKRCVCDAWHPDDPNCITLSEECENTPEPDDNEEEEQQEEEEEEAEPESNLWDDNDWIVDYRVVNGVIEGVSDATKRRVEAARNIKGDTADFMTRDNVVRATSVLSDLQWEIYFPNAHEELTYLNFMRAISRFPKFCGEAKPDSEGDSDLFNSCKVELAALLAHMSESSV